MKKKIETLLITLLVLVLTACDPAPKPLPQGQMRIALPEHEYIPVETICPYRYEAPYYAQLVSRPAPVLNCWSDLKLPEIKAVLHLTHRKLQGDLAMALDECHDLAYGHVSMADNISDQAILHPEHRVYGTMFHISGNVASNLQFYLTDSVDHFLRGALYFDAVPNKDSLAPVVEHVALDLQHMFSTLEWQALD